MPIRTARIVVWTFAAIVLLLHLLIGSSVGCDRTRAFVRVSSRATLLSRRSIITD